VTPFESPCSGRWQLFEDPTRTDEARAFCKRNCQRLIECRAWALRTEVAGMCGGFTEHERELWRHDQGISLEVREPTPDESRVLVAELTRLGFSATEIGAQLRMAPRTVTRHRQAIREGTMHKNRTGRPRTRRVA
jgi:hypothetical protein